MSKNIRISAAYWEKLSDKEKYFIQVNAAQFGVSLCKSILSLAKYFPVWDDIVPSTAYLKDTALSVSWIVFYKGKMIGALSKSYNIGISERIHVFNGEHLENVWHNFTEKKPNKSTQKIICEKVNSFISSLSM